MERLFVTGGARLEGSVRVSGAKNSALKLMAAALLAPGRSVVRNVPRIRDCAVMAELLEHFGVAVDLRDGTASRRDREVSRSEAPRRQWGNPRIDRGARAAPRPHGTGSRLAPRRRRDRSPTG
jgi:UDP-N-acetylglucosamine enolpyruvyl transferase